MAETMAELNKVDLEVYSTDEKQIGVWIDGKTLYEKTIVGTQNFPSSAGSIVIHTQSDADTLFLHEGFCSGTGTPFPYVAYNAEYAIACVINSSKQIMAEVERDRSSFGKPVITIRYTKA
jgi:hypothetical protein